MLVKCQAEIVLEVADTTLVDGARFTAHIGEALGHPAALLLAVHRRHLRGDYPTILNIQTCVGVGRIRVKCHRILLDGQDWNRIAEMLVQCLRAVPAVAEDKRITLVRSTGLAAIAAANTAYVSFLSQAFFDHRYLRVADN